MMNLKPFSFLLISFIISGIFSCKEFIEPSISKKKITRLAPGNNYQSSIYAVNFWWDEVEDAFQYRLQVVSPQFDNIGALIADTLVKSNKFTLNLQPGIYQWRVLAENGSTRTDFSSAGSFTVLASSIKAQMLLLGTPPDNTLTRQSSITFNWQQLYGATKYRIQIDTNNFSDESRLLFNQAIPGNQYTFNFPIEQQYQWRVQAQNDTAESRWSAVRVVRYDHTPPLPVPIVSPDNNKTVTLPISLHWNSVTTAVRYKLYVFKADSVSDFNINFPALVTNTDYTFNLGNSGDRIYWKISAIDEAGNEGQSSPLRSFVIQ